MLIERERERDAEENKGGNNGDQLKNEGRKNCDVRENEGEKIGMCEKMKEKEL